MQRYFDLKSQGNITKILTDPEYVRKQLAQTTPIHERTQNEKDYYRSVLSIKKYLGHIVQDDTAAKFKVSLVVPRQVKLAIDLRAYYHFQNLNLFDLHHEVLSRYIETQVKSFQKAEIQILDHIEDLIDVHEKMSKQLRALKHLQFVHNQYVQIYLRSNTTSHNEQYANAHELDLD